MKSGQKMLTQFGELEIWRSISNSWKSLYRDVEKALAPTGLSIAEVRILHMLHENGPLPMTRLTAELFVTPGATTSMVDVLEDQGLVERLRSAGDRRVITIKITASGETTIRKAISLHKQYLAKKFESLSKKDVIFLVETLDRLSKA